MISRKFGDIIQFYNGSIYKLGDVTFNCYARKLNKAHTAWSKRKFIIFGINNTYKFPKSSKLYSIKDEAYRKLQIREIILTTDEYRSRTSHRWKLVGRNFNEILTTDHVSHRRRIR